jgi:hypothetical protein
MAKGKEGLQAERRRYEAAMDHLHRLTEELADYKIRVRRVEADAAATPGLRKEVQVLRAQVEEITGPALEAERDAHAKTKSDHEQKLMELSRVIGEAITRGADGSDRTLADFSLAHLEVLDRILPDHRKNTQESRSVRRMKVDHKMVNRALDSLSNEHLKKEGWSRVGGRFHNRGVDTD